MIEVSRLTKNFGKTRALDSLNFTVKDGVAFGLLGRNGAGKTTCIRIIMDIFRADDGRVTIDGAPSYKSPYKIGYLPEERGLYQKRVILEQMIYIGRLRGLSAREAPRKARERLEELEASEYADRKLDTLSKGNQQKIQLAIALINDPDIIILDEPFSGLDPVNAGLLKEIVRKQARQGKTVIFSSHQMAQVEEFCDDICLIDKGKSVLEGNLERIKKSYPRNIVYFEPGADWAGDPIPSLRSSMGPSVRDVCARKSGYLVTLASPDDRGALLRALGEIGVVPEAFMVQEPTLEEIFIGKVGDDPAKEGAPRGDADSEGGKRSRGGLFGRAKKDRSGKIGSSERGKRS
ncbi:MAG: ATP-binding cassette domain-containing protein [Clostridiales Family XIII bacterium]|jgi:ABC-2 type transport system ATP-binding protein|nr:ATP-binding cassette domain-containing protein [Clostridiales Family XIII bacterium]